MKQNLKTNGMNIFVKVLSITSNHVVLLLNEEKYLIPLARVPQFYNAKIEDVFDVRMNGGDEIRWDNLDIDLDIESLKYPEKYPLIARQYPLEEQQPTAAESDIIYKVSLK